MFYTRLATVLLTLVGIVSPLIGAALTGVAGRRPFWRQRAGAMPTSPRPKPMPRSARSTVRPTPKRASWPAAALLAELTAKADGDRARLFAEADGQAKLAEALSAFSEQAARLRVLPDLIAAWPDPSPPCCCRCWRQSRPVGWTSVHCWAA